MKARLCVSSTRVMDVDLDFLPERTTQFYQGGILASTKQTRKHEGHYTTTTTCFAFFLASFLFVYLFLLMEIIRLNGPSLGRDGVNGKRRAF